MGCHQNVSHCSSAPVHTMFSVWKNALSRTSASTVVLREHWKIIFISSVAEMLRRDMESLTFLRNMGQCLERLKCQDTVALIELRNVQFRVWHEQSSNTFWDVSYKVYKIIVSRSSALCCFQWLRCLLNEKAPSKDMSCDVVNKCVKLLRRRKKYMCARYYLWYTCPFHQVPLEFTYKNKIVLSTN